MYVRIRTIALVASASSALIIGMLCALLAYAPTTLVGIPYLEEAAINRIALEAVEACARSSYAPTCYDERVPRLLDAGLTMEEVFTVTRRLQQLDTSYIYCHVLGHNIAAKETAKDPSKWTEVIARCPSGTCENGCQHGAIQQRFRTDALPSDDIERMTPELATVCESSSRKTYSGIEQANCYHGLGHLGMYASGGNMETTLRMCESIDSLVKTVDSKNDMKEHCFEGAFMQVFQFLDAEDRALVEDVAPNTQEEAVIFCEQFTGARQAACHRESWPFYRDRIQVSEGLASFCAYMQESVHAQYCYNVLLNVTTALLQYNHERITMLCAGLPANRVGQCFAHSAFQFLHSDERLGTEAVRLCSIAEKYGAGDRCYGELLFYSGYGYHEGSPAFRALCAAMPEPWRARCAAGEGKNISRHVFDT